MSTPTQTQTVTDWTDAEIEEEIDRTWYIICSLPSQLAGSDILERYYRAADERERRNPGSAYDEEGETPDSYLDRVDGHWYVVRYDRTAPQIHAQNCETCQEVSV